MTLIELLIAIALLAIVTTLSYRGLDTLSRSSERLLGENERWQAVAAFFGRFASDVAQALPRPVRIGAAGESPASAPALPAWHGQPLPTLDAQDDTHRAPLEFTRASTTGRDAVRLAYRLRAHRLELLIWPVLDRAAVEPAAPAAKPQIYTLLEGVSELRFRHLDASGIWQERWPLTDDRNGQETLPRAIEIDLTLTDGVRLRRVFALPS